MSHDGSSSPISWCAGLLLLSIRGLLLWIVVPLATVAWAAIKFLTRAKRVTYGQYLGWVDLNLIAILHASLLRPLIRNRMKRIPFAEMNEVTYRMRILDFW